MTFLAILVKLNLAPNPPTTQRSDLTPNGYLIDLAIEIAYTKSKGLYHTLSHKGGAPMPEVVIGKVTDFFARPVVAGIELAANVKVGDNIHIKGHTTDLELAVTSMQINNVNVDQAKAGDNIGIKVSERVRRGDIVYKVTD